jgi:hypothetical protein
VRFSSAARRPGRREAGVESTTSFGQSISGYFVIDQHKKNSWAGVLTGASIYDPAQESYMCWVILYDHGKDGRQNEPAVQKSNGLIHALSELGGWQSDSLAKSIAEFYNR